MMAKRHKTKGGDLLKSKFRSRIQAPKDGSSVMTQVKDMKRLGSEKLAALCEKYGIPGQQDYPSNTQGQLDFWHLLAVTLIVKHEPAFQFETRGAKAGKVTSAVLAARELVELVDKAKEDRMKNMPTVAPLSVELICKHLQSAGKLPQFFTRQESEPPYSIDSLAKAYRRGVDELARSVQDEVDQSSGRQ